ncbi:MAG: hypothetical protein LIO46_03260 [Clostridiales bacterium]|nr:hypothetical protein [Clostridiales bacterium]
MKVSSVIKTLVTLALAAAAVWAGFTAYAYITRQDPAQDEAYLALSQALAEETLYQSDFETIFYSRDPAAFYQYRDGALEPYDSSKKTLTMTFHSETIKFDLHYIRIDGQYFGFGAYEDDIDSYFVKAMNVPKSSNYSQSNCIMLLFDGLSGDAPEYLRLYGDAFIYDIENNAYRAQYVQDRNRAVMSSGKKRDDYAIFTTEMLMKATSTRTVFLYRGMYQHSTAPDRTMDLNTIASGYYSRPYLTDVVLDYAYDTGGGMFYYKRTDDGFESRIYASSSSDQVIYQFDGSPTDYIRSGEYVISTAKLTDDETQTHTVVKGIDGSEQTFTLEKTYDRVDALRVSEDGRYLIILGTWRYDTGEETQSTLQMAGFVDLETGTSVQYTGNQLFDTDTGIYFLEDTAFLMCGGQFITFSLPSILETGE